MPEPFAPREIFHDFFRLLIFSKINFFRKIILGMPSDWIQIRPNVMPGLICCQRLSADVTFMHLWILPPGLMQLTRDGPLYIHVFKK